MGPGTQQTYARLNGALDKVLDVVRKKIARLYNLCIEAIDSAGKRKRALGLRKAAADQAVWPMHVLRKTDPMALEEQETSPE